MSSSNLVSVTYEREDEYGVRMDPAADSNMNTARFTSESLSGTPTTTESEELRTDRMSGGLVATGLEVNGDINGELAPDHFFDSFFEAGMMDTWVAEEIVNTTFDLVPDGSDPQKAVLTLGAEFTNLVPGTLVRFTPAGGDPITVSIITVDTPSTVFTVATVRDQAAVSDSGDVTVPSYCDIGKTMHSFVVSKAYTDVIHEDTTPDEHSQTYGGVLVDGFTVNATYGEIMTTTFATVGNSYLQEAPSYPQQVITAGGTVNPAGTTQQLNASIDVPLVIASETGESTDYCIETLEIALTNNLEPQNCIGKMAATAYNLGTARVAVTMSVYLSDTSYDSLVQDKMNLTPIAVTYLTENDDGGYAFHMPAVQLVFPDPAAEGQDQQTMVEAAGSAKVGANGESSLRVYRL